jgi:amino acid adenylation domain-containing protein
VIDVPAKGIGRDVETDHAYWRRLLLGGGRTTLPRWGGSAVAGVGECEVRLPDDIAADLRRLAVDLAVSLPALWLTAHAKVLAVLAGEREVTTGIIAAPSRAPLPCPLTTEPQTWREFALETYRAIRELQSHAEFAVEELQRELKIGPPTFETEFDPAGTAVNELGRYSVLRVGHMDHGAMVLRVRYRTDAFDTECAQRIAGYHVHALALLADDPDAEHTEQSLLSWKELLYQLDCLAGPRLSLPDRRVHELIEERVRAHPDALAAVHGERRWTYRQLNQRANQLAWALLDRGLAREDVVAVVSERTLDWLAAVLAVFKAGGTYLPVEPHFPADRMTRMLTRAGCRLVLAERGGSPALERAIEALPGCPRIHFEEVREADFDSGDPRVHGEPDQLAYVYFTSGSTGEPKGVMCEHAGMLNHMIAKIHDLGIREGDVVAQTAPQCFDISLWQLLAALLAGGTTLLVEQDVILDAERFLDRIADGRAAVVQVVPSYLEVLLAYLALHPREFPYLRCVSVTGEAVKPELVERWFAAQPSIRLVNAYGLTETSDDTNHEIMEHAPERGGVPLGRPIHNVNVYIVDPQLALVPLGAPGEIVFSGVCVGRGYIHDPERTQRAFLTDRYRQGQRLYRSGDFGRWRPDGKLEFLGRRDSQVKVSGFRIEIGEVENALLHVPGVRDGAVVVAGRADDGRRLVACYRSEQPLDALAMRTRMSESLPEYMVPAAFLWRLDLPLTENGKIDRRALALLAGELEASEAKPERPLTAIESRLAAAWAHVLGIPQESLGRSSHFFDLGGTSLSAVKLAIALERAVSVPDLAEHPVLAELAALIEDRAAHTLQHSHT